MSPDKLDTMFLLIIPHLPVVFPPLLAVTEECLVHPPALRVPPGQADAPQGEDGRVMIVHNIELLHLGLEVHPGEDLALHAVQLPLSTLGVTHGEVAARAFEGTINSPVNILDYSQSHQI